MTLELSTLLAAMLMRIERDHPVIYFTQEELDIASRRCLRYTDDGLTVELTPKERGGNGN